MILSGLIQVDFFFKLDFLTTLAHAHTLDKKTYTRTHESAQGDQCTNIHPLLTLNCRMPSGSWLVMMCEFPTVCEMNSKKRPMQQIWPQKTLTQPVISPPQQSITSPIPDKNSPQQAETVPRPRERLSRHTVRSPPAKLLCHNSDGAIA